MHIEERVFGEITGHIEGRGETMSNLPDERELVRHQILLTTIWERKLWRVMISHVVLKENVLKVLHFIFIGMTQSDNFW